MHALILCGVAFGMNNSQCLIDDDFQSELNAATNVLIKTALNNYSKLLVDRQGEIKSMRDCDEMMSFYQKVLQRKNISDSQKAGLTDLLQSEITLKAQIAKRKNRIESMIKDARQRFPFIGVVGAMSTVRVR